METLQKLVDPALLAHVLLALVALQASLAGIKLGLDKIKDKTASKLDDQASNVLAVVLAPIDFIVKLLQGNVNK